MWWRTFNCSTLLIYRPRKDERLSWPGWLTWRLTHISGHPSATGRAQDGERTLARDWRSTAEPRGPNSKRPEGEPGTYQALVRCHSFRPTVPSNHAVTCYWNKSYFTIIPLVLHLWWKLSTSSSSCHVETVCGCVRQDRTHCLTVARWLSECTDPSKPNRAFSC